MEKRFALETMVNYFDKSEKYNKYKKRVQEKSSLRSHYRFRCALTSVPTPFGFLLLKKKGEEDIFFLIESGVYVLGAGRIKYGR